MFGALGDAVEAERSKHGRYLAKGLVIGFVFGTQAELLFRAFIR